MSSHRALFKGRVDDIGEVYANAGCVLLPTVEGHGLSIKAVEALSCGAPLVATSLAFRGMQVDPAKLGNVALAENARQFAALWGEAQARAASGEPAEPERSDTRRLYEDAFSPEAYARALAIGRRHASEIRPRKLRGNCRSSRTLLRLRLAPAGGTS